MKNRFTIKLYEITNQEMLRYIETVKNERSVVYNIDNAFSDKEVDYEPEYTFSNLITDLIESILDEQETGNVNFIT